MTLLSRLLTVGTLLVAATSSVTAVSVTSGDDIVARHHAHRHRSHKDHPQRLHERDFDEEEERDFEGEELVEKSDLNATEFDGELEERSAIKKVGLAWANNNNKNIAKFVSATTKYLYTWSPYCPAEAKQLGLECCPMLWGTKQISSFQQNKYKGGKCIMGMNEVNVPSQGYLSVSAGLKLWNEYIAPMKKQGYTTVSPSVTSGADGVAWLKQFYAKVGSANRPDVLAFHYYGMSASEFISYAEKFHAISGGTVWVTEIACQNFGDPKKGQCTQEMVDNFMDQTTAWMKKTSWIGAYFFFGLFEYMYNVEPTNRMVVSSGTPNALGHKYVGHY